MKIIITGSGGCVCTPKPLCDCHVCTEARVKGHPYMRYGPSLYIEDAALLIDTPEDITHAINHAGIKQIDNILYSHWDPDHTLGMRVMEQLKLEWLNHYEGLKPENPLNIYAHPEVMADLKGIRSKFGPILDYYEFMGLIRCKAITDETAINVRSEGLNDIRSIMIDKIKLSLVKVPKEKAASVFVIESGGKKLIYSPCDCKPYPENDLFYDADLLIMGNTVIGDVLKHKRDLYPGHPLRSELHVFGESVRIKEKYRIKDMIMTHIEETWGKTYDDYLKLEQELKGVRFAYDGMEITL